METLTLYNGVEIPVNGFGVYQVRKEGRLQKERLSSPKSWI